MSKKHVIPNPILQKGQSIPKVQNKDVIGDKPQIGITYLDVEHDYGIKGLSEKAKRQNGNRQIYKELDSFLQLVRKYQSIEELMDRHCPKSGLKTHDSSSKCIIESIRKQYNIETGELLHIHCKGNGKGEFVLHGFTVYNIFEVIWFDPNHEVHKTK